MKILGFICFATLLLPLFSPASPKPAPTENFVEASSLALPRSLELRKPSSLGFPRSFPSLRSGMLHSGMSAEILRYVNEYRHSKGLKPLQANSFISSVALDHSRDMLSGKSPFGHEGFHDRIDRILKRLGPIHVAAENVASGPMGAREVVDGWLHSPGHRRNIEGNFRLTGIGLAYGRRGMIYFTQIFTL